MIALSFYGDGNFNSQEKSNITFGPGDMQNLFLSRLLCEQLSPRTDSLYSGDYLFSYLYILNEQPSLTGSANVSFQDEYVIFDQHKQRDFHFYSGTVIAFDACASNETYWGFGTFYLVKGLAAYDEWAYSEDEDSAPPLYEGYLQVANYCGNGQQPFSYNVTEEDQYYFIFINHKNINPYPATIVVNYDIKRTLYKIESSSIIDSCRFSTMPCSVHVPFLTARAAVLVYGEPSNWEDKWENAVMDVQCSPRVWMYALTSAAGVLVIIMCMLCVCLSCCCCNRLLTEEKDEADTPLLRSTLLDEKSGSMKGGSNEMNDPSRDNSVNRSAPATPQYVGSAREDPGSSYPSPSFKKSDKFSLGSATVETFKTKA